MREHAIVFTDESLCRPEFKKASMVTNIVARWEASGVLEHTSRYQGQYGDFLGPESYHQALNLLLQADEMFMSLPSSVRDRYDNSVEEFLAGVDAGDDFLVEAGILKKPAEKSSKPAVRSRSRDGSADASEASEAESADAGDNNTG